MLEARIRWGCRRGMLELDLLLGRVLERHLTQWNVEEKQDFISLLEQADPDLMQWCLSDGPVPAQWMALITTIRACRLAH